jgi:hypothetical protein
MTPILSGQLPSGDVRLELYDVNPNSGTLVPIGQTRTFNLEHLSNSECRLAASQARVMRALIAINGRQMEAYIEAHGAMLVDIGGEQRRVVLVRDDYTRHDYFPAWIE